MELESAENVDVMQKVYADALYGIIHVVTGTNCNAKLRYTKYNSYDSFCTFASHIKDFYLK